jgi:hypothetical protein
MHLPRGQRVGARGDVGDVDELYLVEVGPAFFVIVGIALHLGAHAGLERLQDEGAGPGARLPIDAAIVLRL